MKLSVVTPLWQDRSAAENLEVAALADQLGFPELWIGEMATYDGFALATAIGLKTRQIIPTIGPLAVSVRTPMNIAMGIASVADLIGRETHVALGASSVVVVEEWHGRARARTATHLAETARIVRSLLAGEKADFQGDLASCSGYRLRLDAPSSSVTIAAFGPAAVLAAARRADRMVLNMVTPESLAKLRHQMETAASKAERVAPKLAVWLPCSIDPAPEAIGQLLRGVIGYLAAPGYSDMFAAAGFAELVTFSRTRPHPKELLAAIPDTFAATIGLVGSEDQITDRLAAYRAAGADEVCLVPVTAGDPAGKKTLELMSRRLN